MNGPQQVLHDQTSVLSLGHQVWRVTYNGSARYASLAGAQAFTLPATMKEDVLLEAYEGAGPDLRHEQILYHSPRSWVVHTLGPQLRAFSVRDLRCGEIWRTAIVDEGRSLVKVYTNTGRSQFAFLPHPLAFPAGELALIQLLTCSEAALLHACSVVDAGQGLLFCGPSGAGKTTMARLWLPSAEVLNDDRTVLALVDGQPHIFAVPWSGEMRRAKPGGAAIRSVFFIEQSNSNRIIPLTRDEVSRRMIRSSWVPVWEHERALQVMWQIARTVANRVLGYRLCFRKTEQVVDIVRDHVSHQET